MSDSIKTFWEEFLKSLPVEQRSKTYTAWSFGNTPQMMDELGALVLRGDKRATTSLAWIYEKFPEEKIPIQGEYSIILDSKKKPLCVIQSISVTTRKFSEIDEDYARTEGEGDKSLQYWREGHWKYFVSECELMGREPSEDMPVICEIFEVVYP